MGRGRADSLLGGLFAVMEGFVLLKDVGLHVVSQISVQWAECVWKTCGVCSALTLIGRLAVWLSAEPARVFTLTTHEMLVSGSSQVSEQQISASLVVLLG